MCLDVGKCLASVTDRGSKAGIHGGGQRSTSGLILDQEELRISHFSLVLWATEAEK